MNSVVKRDLVRLDGGEVLELPYAPDAGSDFVIRQSGELLELGYLLVDDDALEYEFPFGFVFCHSLPNFAGYDSHVGRLYREAEGADPGRTFLIERYDHSRVVWALVGESSAVDRAWDVSHACGFIRVPADVSEESAPQFARDVLSEYTAWCNGDVYGTVVCRYRLFGDEWVREDHDACWGRIGLDWAVRALEEDMV